MMFDKPEFLNLLVCTRCGATGQSAWAKCRECSGMALGYTTRNKWLYWYYPLTRYYLALERYRRLVNKIRFITVVVLGINFWIWLGFLVYHTGLYEQTFSSLDNGSNVLDTFLWD
jgi:ribosomal protein L40E